MSELKKLENFFNVIEKFDKKLNYEDLMKSAALSNIYKSPDFAYFYLNKFDEKNNSSYCNLLQEIN